LGFWHDASESNPIPFDWVLPQHAFETSIYPEGIILSLGHQLYLFVVTSPEAERLLATWRELHALKGSLAWHATCLSQGLFEIYPNTAELFLPHHVNMHLTGQLSFNKGCYKGQEIIARMHYRASIKHTLKVFNLNRNLSIESGMKLMSLDNKRELGVIIDYCPLSTTGDYLITTSFVIEHFNKVLINGETVTLSLSGNTDMNVK
jgi:folate-binding protein YgfZ